MQPAYAEGACIGCGLCRKVCPYEYTHVGVEAHPDCYAAIHRDEEVRRNSSSGGAFTALSDRILAKCGIVYGVAAGGGFRLSYERASTPEERNRLRGSKYAQCDACDTFSLVEDDLRIGLTVLFTGTPCQVSGLKAYLAVKRVPTEKLYTVDNICHGVASPLVWEDYFSRVDSLYVKGEDVSHFTLRSKRAPWRNQLMDFRLETRDLSDELNRDFSWNRLYQTTFATRQSCFDCRFTSYDRVSDITLADYWNYENSGLTLDDSLGISLVMANTSRGRELLVACEGDLEMQQTTKEAAWQMHLEQPTPELSGRDAFWDTYRSDKNSALAKYARGTLFMRIARAVTPFLRKVGLYALATKVLRKVAGNGKRA